MKKLPKTCLTASGRTAFTLVELLLVIMIIAILASLGVGVMAQAQEDAAVAATRSRMSMIQKILEIELEDYEVRRSPVPFAAFGSLISGSSLNVSAGQTLLHAKNLKRMIIADLIRAEMPDGSRSGDELSLFPSDTLLDFFDDDLGISRDEALPWFPVNYTVGNEQTFTSRLPLVSGWSTWSAYQTFPAANADQARDGIDLEAVDKAELLYQILLNIDIDGVPAIDQLSSQAIGDTDGDGTFEVLDAWGEPLYLQWQQEGMVAAGSPANPSNGIWSASGVFAGLSNEHITPPASGRLQKDFCMPVLPTQIRPFLISERLIKIDGLPLDYDLDHAF